MIHPQSLLVRFYFYLSTLLVLINSGSAVAEEDSKPLSTFARFVPERSDDFAWENDKIAFRAYGPALREKPENAGIDCWLKRVDYPIIDKWYRQAKEERKSYHKDHGEGLDNYHVGHSAGCGGTALWLDGQREALETFSKWQMVESNREKTVFVLTYEKRIGDSVYRETKRVTIELGQRLFRAESTFWRDGQLAVDLPIAVGVTTHDGKATPMDHANSRWVAAWETLDGDGLGTGVLIHPDYPTQTKIISSEKPDVSHALLLTETDAAGKIIYYAGYGWARAGEITSPEAWSTYLNQFSPLNL